MALLTAKPALFNILINNDAGSGARQNLATWKPHLDPGWYYLGPAANNGFPSPPITGIIIKPEYGGVVAPIDDWELVWSNTGSGNKNDYALWRGLPANRVDFVVIGGFFTRSNQKPTAEDSRDMVAIHRDALIHVTHGKEVWSDRGSRARSDGTVWDISTDGFIDAVGTGAFIPVEGYYPPRDALTLNRRKLEGEF
ncbi:hypothetical protein DXG01_014332 [Tephrocybe rancida]|nr:hypothetical protein DXG01_014332 [Tephrocybe rancida]